jgi:HEAT repeat protein
MLIEAIRSDDWKIKGMVVDMIVALKGDGVTERFSADLDKLDVGTQVLVLGALVARGETEPLRPVITKAVSNPNAEIRALAIKSLGDIGDAGSIKVLVNVIEAGKNEEDKTLAASSLRRLPGKDINGQIIKLMLAARATDKVKLIEILHDRDAIEAVDVLLAAASDKDGDVRTAAFKALGDLAGGDNQKALIRLLINLKGETGRTEAERALIAASRNLDKTASTESILAVMDSPDLPIAKKCSLLRVLGGISSEKGFAEVRRAFKDARGEVRDAAVRTLADWPLGGRPDATAASTLLEIFQTTSNQTHRALALRGCVRQLSDTELVSADTLNIAGELMKGADTSEEKKLVLACLATSGNPGAIEIIEPLLGDSSVKAEAELAMLAVARNMTGANPELAEQAAQRLRKKADNQKVRREAAAIIKQTEKKRN